MAAASGWTDFQKKKNQTLCEVFPFVEPRGVSWVALKMLEKVNHAE
jgi:hypothetical protein